MARICPEPAPTHLRIATLRSLCCHEYPDDAPDAHAAQHDDDEADETQVVLRPSEFAPDLVLGGLVAAHSDERVFEGLSQVPRQPRDAALWQLQQQSMGRAAAEAEQRGRLKVFEVDEHARPEAERSSPAARLGRDDAPDREAGVADNHLVADGDIELREQLGPDQQAPPLQQRMRVRLATAELEHAVKRVGWFDTDQLDQPRDRLSLVGRPDHGQRFNDVNCLGHPERCRETVDLAPGVRLPRAARRQRDVRAQQGARLGAKGGADVLHDGTERGNRGDADREAEEKEQQPAPGPPHLPPRHPDDEHHVNSRQARRARRAAAIGRRRARRGPHHGWRASASPHGCVGSRAAVP